MSSRTLSEIVGKKLRIDVAEPWDFSSTAGHNLLVGIATASSGPDAAKPWVLCNLSEFRHDGVRVVQGVLVSRHRRKEPLEHLSKGLRVGVNVVFDAAVTVSSTQDVETLLERDLPFLAGSAYWIKI